MMLLHIVWAFVANPAIWISALVVIALLAALWFFGGPVLFYKIVTDARVWLAAAIIAGVVGYLHMADSLEAANKKIAGIESQKQSHNDRTTVENNREKTRTKRAQEDTRLQKAIDDAPEGQEVDYLLDQIAREQQQAGVPPGAHDGQPQSGGVRDSSGTILP